MDARSMTYDAIDRLYAAACGYEFAYGATSQYTPMEDARFIKKYIEVNIDETPAENCEMVADVCASLRNLADSYGGDKRFNENIRVAMWRAVNALANLDGVKPID